LIEKNERTVANNQHKILSTTVSKIVLQEEHFNRQVASLDNLGYKVLRKNQLVFSPQNIWMGNINVNLDYDIGIVSPSYKIYEIVKINPLYLSYIIKMNFMMHKYKECSEQGASIVRRNLNIDEFFDILIPIPAYHQQEHIVKIISSFITRYNNEKEMLSKLQVQKTFLLQSMFI